MKSLINQAIDSKQYDGDVYWEHEPNKNLEIQNFYFDSIIKHKNDFINSNLLEIGSGNGWFLKRLDKLMINEIDCIEPSIKNNEYLKKINNINYFNCDFNNFKANKKYDVIISTMVFGHIKDLKSTFLKLNSILKKGGVLILIVADYEYYTTKKEGWDLEVEKIDNEESVIKIKNGTQSICEIIRKVERYIKFAELSNFKIEDCIPMKPSLELIRLSSRIAKSKNKPITHLLKFRSQ